LQPRNDPSKVFLADLFEFGNGLPPDRFHRRSCWRASTLRVLFGGKDAQNRDEQMNSAIHGIELSLAVLVSKPCPFVGD
jgi:hypothetical protein